MEFGKLNRFKNRLHAGALLAHELGEYARRQDVLVLALPRGGVPVGFSIARKLKVPLDVLLVRKLGLPGQEEYAIGAIASGGACILQAEVLSVLGISPSTIEEVAQREMREIIRREKLYRGDRPPLQLREKTVILVDDGIATGSTIEVAIKVVRESNPARLVVAVPVAPLEICTKLRPKVDQLVCLSRPELFCSVGFWYQNFEQVGDQEVKMLLDTLTACEEQASKSRPS